MMGYYSEVIIVLSDEAQRSDDPTIPFPKPLLEVFGWADEIKKDPETGCIILVWRSVKWDEGFSDVKIFMQWLDSLKNKSYRFYRTGEEIGDYEEHGGLRCHRFGVYYGLCYDTEIGQNISQLTGVPLRKIK